MKTLKQFFVLIVIALVAFAVVGCKEDDPPNDDNVVKERSTTITLFEGKTATVKGVFDKEGLNDAAGKIANQLNTVFNTNAAAQNPYREIISRGITFIVETNPDEYRYIKTIGDGKTIYIALSVVDTVAVNDGMVSIYTNGSVIS